jgi:hypothetical protein
MQMILETIEFALFFLVLFFIVPGVVISSTRLVRSFTGMNRREAQRYKALMDKSALG